MQPSNRLDAFVPKRIHDHRDFSNGNILSRGPGQVIAPGAFHTMPIDPRDAATRIRLAVE